MSRKKKSLIIAGIVLALAVAAGLAVLVFTVRSYQRQARQAASFEGVHSTFGYTPPILAGGTRTYPFLVRQQTEARFVLWSKALTGRVRLSIRDADGRAVFVRQGRTLDAVEAIPLQRGAYTVELDLSRYTGALRFGLNEARFVTQLPADRYRYVDADPPTGFHWDYILYTPESVTSAHLLVVPNNTGYPDHDLAFHREAAKSLIQEMRHLADDLGTPLLVPVFPRPAGALEAYYTHNLDRDVLQMTAEGYRRLDLQLLAMVDDARGHLADAQIQTDRRFLLWGFSASGTFSDRFSLLHPDRLVAVAAGGCTHSLPFAEYAGENLPYPVGTYDDEALTGAPFDAETFAALPRFLYKGDQDAGGTITTDDGVYPADEYYDRFVRPTLEAESAAAPVPLVTGSALSPAQEDLLRYRIYDGAAFVDAFTAVREIYAEAGLDASIFKLYPGAGHEITDAMRRDVRTFFLEHLQHQDGTTG